MKAFSAVALVVCLFPAVASAQGRPAQEFVVTSTPTPINVDGRLEEDEWAGAVAIPLRYEYFPGDNVPAPVDTVCRVAYDAERLYVGCRASDPDIGALRANLADRDVPKDDDTIGFFVDPFNDGRRAFQFRVNARGVQLDALNSDVDDSEDWSWDAIWDAQTQILADGYTVEMAIPFTSLRFPRTSGPQTWGFAASREMPRSAKTGMRSAYVDRNRTCLVCQFDKLTGIQGVTPGRNLEFDPTVTLARTDRRAIGGRFAAGNTDAQAGLSARWSLRPNVVLSGTINPDFYQVEADAAQLDVNTQFQLRFSEKRPFFLEGADLFRTPYEVVFTRTVADPSSGIKLTGKEGAHAFGAFMTRDEVTGVLVPGFDSSSFLLLDRANTSTVLRYRRDLGSRGSTVGVLFTGRQAGDYGNSVGGLDGVARLTDADTVRLQWLGSQTDYPDGSAASSGQAQGSIGGQAFFGEYTRDSRNWEWNAAVLGASPGFRADSGFMPQVSFRQMDVGIDRKLVGAADRWFNEITLGFGCDRTTDWDGGRTSWGCDTSLDYSGPWQLEASYNPAPNSEYFDGRTYSNFRHNINVSVRPSGALAPYVSIVKGGTIDFANSRQAQQLRLTAGADYNLFGRLTGDVSYTEQALDVEGGQRLFVARLTQASAVQHLTPRTFVRVILQYRDTTRDPLLYRSQVGASSRQFFSQWLFSYKVNPQTVFLAGYSDNASGTNVLDLARTDRTFFLKVGYAWLP
ncbi:MAG: DUF5916 domain-containing protein [Vicinamibacterales bacterium]